MAAVKVGARVGYAAHFLRSVGGGFNIAERGGTVVSISGPTAKVKWDDEDEPRTVLLVNIAVPGSLSFGDPHHKPRAL